MMTAMLRTRMLENLFNEPPTWLDNTHRDLGVAAQGTR